MRSRVVHKGRRSARFVLVALLLVAASGLNRAQAQEAPTTAPVGPNVNSFGFTVRPYSQEGTPPRDALEYQLPAGQTTNDRISVANLTDQPKTFFLYPSDAYNTSSGGLALRLKTDPAQDAGGWVTLPVASYTIPPKSAALVPITVNVPADATPGDHTAGIVAEEQIAATTAKQSGGIQPIHRVGTRMYVRVEGPVTPQLQVTQVAVSHDDPILPIVGSGSASVTYTVANTGNIRLRLDEIKVQVNGPLGYTAKSFTQANDPPGTLPEELLPGNTVVYSQAMGALPPLFLLSATVSVKAEDPLQQAPVSASANVWFWVVPWLLVAVVVLAILVFFGRRWWRRRRPAASDGDADPDDSDDPDDGSGTATLESEPAGVSAGGDPSDVP